MAVLVTGGAGYIGSHMVWNLIDAGEDVVVLDRLSTGFAWAVAPEAKLVVGDVGDRPLVREVIRENGVDAIIHFAGSIIVPESIADPLAYYENNTCRSRNLIEVAITENVRNFIFSSTAAVYGESGGQPIAEEFKLSPATPYGQSKLMVEQMLRDVAGAHDFRFTALRYFNVAGADPAGRTGQSTPGTTHLIKAACEAATGERRALTVFGSDYPTPDGTCVRDFIHVTDLVTAHAQALVRLRAGGKSLIANCGYGHGYSVLEVIDAVRRASGADLDVMMGARRPGDLPAVIADSSLARRELDWTPQFDDLDVIVAHALNWSKRLRVKNGVSGLETPDPDHWSHILPKIPAAE